MTGNAWFPSPSPSLASITASVDALHDAQVVTTTRIVGSVASRNTARVALMQAVRALQTYVQNRADADPEHARSIVSSAGFAIKRSTAYARAGFAVKRGPISASVVLSQRAAKTRAAYEWQWSLDKLTWQSLPTTLTARTTVYDLPIQKKVYFRTRVITSKGGAGNWSDPVALMIT